MHKAGMRSVPFVKVPVMGAKEPDGPVVAKPVNKADARTAIELVMSSNDEDATVYRDGTRIYGQIPCNHDSVCHRASEYVSADVHTHSIGSACAALKHSITRPWHHVSPKRLHRYVHEAAMRLNIGDCEIDAIDQMKTLVKQIGGNRVVYRDLIG